ncbi:MAG: YbaK/EbsC family protein [Candidatus Promineifilaceae bacterium]|nr:YbaK/EbsC family protein [Candidatus Promineifilaceae bacterium]
MYNSTDLIRYINRHGIAAELVRLEQETPTVTAAAAAVGVQPDNILKSLLFLADDTTRLVIASGTDRVNYKALADYLGVSRRKLRLARPAEVVEITGYPVGTVPPFGHRQKSVTLVSQRVLDQDVVFAGGGEIDALLRLSAAELLRVTDAEIVALQG